MSRGNSFTKNKKNITAVFCILLFAACLYTYALWRIPTNITGDESVYLESVYQIFFNKHGVSPFELLGDRSQPALNFYWMALWIKIFGLQHAVLAMRFSTTVTSFIFIAVFFFILRRRSSVFISTITILLFATNVLYINFSRAGWFNIGAMLLGTLMIFFLEIAVKENKKKWFLVAGFFAGIACYGYFAGKIYPVVGITYLAWRYVKTHSKQKLQQFGYFFVVFFLTILPLVFTVLGNMNIYFFRPRTVFIFSQNDTKIVETFLDQTRKVMQGFVLFDGSVMGNGRENLRYFPESTPIIDLFTALCFFIGAFLCMYHKKESLWGITYIFGLLFLGVLTVDAPNLARLLVTLPCIYLFSTYGILYIYNRIQIISGRNIALIFVTLVCMLVITFNTQKYFIWALGKENAEARQPALSYEDFPKWQEYQIQRVLHNKYTITLYAWENIKKEY